MKPVLKALVWASIIIVAAIFMNAQGMNDNASFGVVAGLSGAAWGSISAGSSCGSSCGTGCLQ